jgi:hypothetical protein
MRLRPRRWVLAVIAVAVLALAVDVGLFLAGRSHRTAAAPASGVVADNAVHVLDPKSGREIARVPVGGQPTSVAAGFGSAWVLNRDDGTVTRIDAHSRKAETITPHDPANGIAMAHDGIWMLEHPRLTSNGSPTSLLATTLERLDPGTHKVGTTLKNDSGTLALAAGGGSLWTFSRNTGGRDDTRMSATTGAFLILDEPIYGDLVAANRTDAYFVSSLGARIQRVDIATDKLTASLSLARIQDLVAAKPTPDPTDIALGGGSIWLSQTDGTVLRVDLALRRVVHKTKACGSALAVAYGEGAVWAACGEGTAVRIDPATGAASPPIHVGGLPRGIAAGEGAVWVTVD